MASNLGKETGALMVQSPRLEDDLSLDDLLSVRRGHPKSTVSTVLEMTERLFDKKIV